MSQDIQLHISSELAQLLANNTQLSTLDNGEAQLVINGCTPSIINSLADLLKQCAQATPAKDYSVYFSAIAGSTLYKPNNPRIAVMQVAKNYNVDMNALLKAFKEQGC